MTETKGGSIVYQYSHEEYPRQPPTHRFQLRAKSESAPAPIPRNASRNIHRLPLPEPLRTPHADRWTSRGRDTAILTRVRAPAVRSLASSAASGFPPLPRSVAVFASAGWNAIGVEFGVLV